MIHIIVTLPKFTFSTEINANLVFYSVQQFYFKNSNKIQKMDWIYNFSKSATWCCCEFRVDLTCFNCLDTRWMHVQWVRTSTHQRLADHCNTTWKTMHTTTSRIHQPTRFSESWLLKRRRVGGGQLPLTCPPPNSPLLLLVQILGHRTVGKQDLLVLGAGVVKLVLLVGVLQVTSQTF